VIHFARQLPDFLGEAGDVGEGMKVPDLVSVDPLIDPLLNFGEWHVAVSP
jgi:hypothetical protein